MSVAISWANKMQLAKCDIMVGFPISSHKCITRAYKWCRFREDERENELITSLKQLNKELRLANQVLTAAL